jgi:hypothetical protein
MRGRGGVTALSSMRRQAAWNEPLIGGQLKHLRFVWIKRGGVGRQSGSGPSGCTATPRALLSRALRDRAGVAAAVTKRQAATVAAKALPPKLYGDWSGSDGAV